MKNYYHKQTFERRDIDDETMNGWIENQNPKAQNWELTPLEPAYDTSTQYLSWGNGEWIINNIIQPTYTAEEWLDKNGIGGSRQPTLLYLKQSLLASGKISNELNLLENYLQTILGMYAIDPSPKNNWPLPPITFEDAVSSAFNQLNN